MDIESLIGDVKEENDLDKIIKHFLDPNNIHFLSELTGEEITAFSTLYSIAEKYDLVILKNWLGHNLKLRVSKSRAGRKEFVRITQRREEYPMDANRTPWWGRFRQE